jgi:chromosome segregation ATPase
MMDKFKDQEALQKAYESLEKEFTRRSQQLRELQGKIERLTTENKKLTEKNRVMEHNLDFHRNKKFELQQQMDKLKEENTELYKEHTTLIAGSILEKQDIAKDTAKEILQGFNQWLKQAISDSYNKSVCGSMHHGGRNTAFHEVKELVNKVAESKGIEVE